MNYQTKKKVAAALEKIADNGSGLLTPEEVVVAARPKKSPLHDQFEWNDKTAGHQHRLNQARKLISSVIYERKVEHKIIKIPFYVRDPTVGNDQGYRKTIEIKSDEGASAELLRREVKRVVSSMERSKSIAEELGLHEYLEELLETAGIMIGKLDQLAAA